MGHEPTILGCFIVVRGKLESSMEASSFLLPLSSPSHCVTGFTKRKRKKKIRWKSFSTTLTQGRLVVHPEIQRVLGEPGRQILASTEHQALAPAKGLQTMKLSREPGGSDTCTCSQIPLSMPGLGPISYTYKMCFTGPPLMRLCCVLEEALFFSFFLFSI